jgi:hypothetical protein
MALGVTSTGNGKSTGTSVTCTFGSAPAENDIILIGLVQNPATADNYGTMSISGFSSLSANGSIDAADWSRLTVLKKIAGASEGTTYTVNTSVSQDNLACAGIAISGGNTTTPDPTVVNDSTDILPTVGPTIEIPAITTANDNSFDVAFVSDWGETNQGTTSWVSAWNGGFVEDEDVPQTWAVIALAHVLRASSGLQAATTATSAANMQGSLCIRIEIAEAVAGGSSIPIFMHHYRNNIG